jgi:hypothetical protein
MLIEALLDTLEHISSRGTEGRSVVLITWSFNLPSTPGWDDVSDLIGKKSPSSVLLHLMLGCSSLADTFGRLHLRGPR